VLLALLLQNTDKWLVLLLLSRLLSSLLLSLPYPPAPTPLLTRHFCVTTNRRGGKKRSPHPVPVLQTYNGTVPRALTHVLLLCSCFSLWVATGWTRLAICRGTCVLVLSNSTRYSKDQFHIVYYVCSGTLCPLFTVDI